VDVLAAGRAAPAVEHVGDVVEVGAATAEAAKAGRAVKAGGGAAPAARLALPARVFAGARGIEVALASASTSYAVDTALNLSSDARSPGLTSGWYFFASLRYALRISSALASRLTPRVS
jgi:hypothetical protein